MHSEEIKVSERSIYNYIEAGKLSICNLDLRRKMKYKKRRKKTKEIKCDKLTKALGIRRFRKLFPVILTDNGRCFKDALALEYTKSGSPRTKIFYCDSQASWQKPHIEKNHEFIRYVIPRGKSFKGYT